MAVRRVEFIFLYVDGETVEVEFCVSDVLPRSVWNVPRNLICFSLEDYKYFLQIRERLEEVRKFINSDKVTKFVPGGLTTGEKEDITRALPLPTLAIKKSNK